MELKFAFLLLLLSFRMDYSEVPKSSCTGFNRPYKTMNNSCSNFNDVCVKNDDKECETFQNVCKQCPSSNLTILMYLDMINIKDQMTSMKSDDMTKIGYNLIVLYVLVGLIFSLLLFLFLEVVFKIFTKCFKNHSGHNGREYRSIKNSIPPGESYHLPLNAINQQNGQYNGINLNLQNIEDKIMKMENSLKESLQKSSDLRNNMTFKISGASRPVELFIGPKENVLQVKRQICSHWPAAKPGDYKIMIIKYKCQPLNDHNNFMSYNIPTNATLDCELDNKLDPKDFLILKLQGNEDLPQLMKISKELTISELKTFIKCFLNITSSPIITETKTGQEFDNKMVLRNSRLQDNDWIDVITETKRKITAKSLFNESEMCYVEFSNIDMILKIKERIISQLNLKCEDMFLFWNNLLLENNKYIEDYNVNDEFPIKFYYFDKFDGEPSEARNFSKKEFNSLFKGMHSQKNVYIQKYVLGKDICLSSPSFANQLINYQKINSHPRFMSIHGIYLNKDKTNLFVLMEYTSEEVIVEKIGNGRKFSEKEIAELSMQILVGLKHLHDNNIVHKNLKPTNIFVDSLGSIKLSPFNLIQTLDCEDEQTLDVHPFPYRYWAPEILRMEPFTAKSDVWSFGAVLVYIATCEKPYPNLSEMEAGIEIKNYNRIEFDISKFSKIFREFLHICLTADADKRPNVDELLNHSFLND